MPTDEIRLAAVLAAADAERAVELQTLAAMDEQELAYLDAVDTLEDPVTDGIECGGGV